MFRSLLVPLVGVLGFLLTIGASLGATVAVFQWGWLADAVNLDGTGPLMSLTPILVIGILFGLAMDYQVFLVSRMHEAHRRGAAPRDAIITGLPPGRAGRGRRRADHVLGVRRLRPAGEATDQVDRVRAGHRHPRATPSWSGWSLVPAALALLGERAWWLPKWLRWLPELDVEGAALDELEKKKPEPVAVS